jgi:quercetin dioxygenase-like cupin family protein
MITASKLADSFAAHAIWCVSDGESLVPMLAYTTEDDNRKHQRTWRLNMRTFLALITSTLCTMALAGEKDNGKRKVTPLATQDVVEKLDGKDAKVTTVELTIEPGQEGMPHRHPGPVFGYVLEGEYEWAINDQPAKKLRAGDTFYEPTMSLHRVSRNPSDKTATRVLAVMLLPRDAKVLSIPEKKSDRN